MTKRNFNSYSYPMRLSLPELEFVRDCIIEAYNTNTDNAKRARLFKFHSKVQNAHRVLTRRSPDDDHNLLPERLE